MCGRPLGETHEAGREGKDGEKRDVQRPIVA